MKEKNNLCVHCPPEVRGICCYFTLPLDGALYTLTNHPCKYLNIKTKRCRIYETRKEGNPNCLTVEEMKIICSLPKECLYVKNDPNYKSMRKSPETIKNAKLLEQFEQENNLTHDEIAIYHVLRTTICPKCRSEDLIEKWGDYYAILFFKYECTKCGHSWNNLKRQIKYSFKKIKEKKKKR